MSNSWYSKRDDNLGNFKQFPARLHSFKNWRHDAHVSARELSSAGFYYTGESDRVRCAWCHGVIYNWVAGDTALGEHHKHFPHCEFLKQSMITVNDEDVSISDDKVMIRKLQDKLKQLTKTKMCILCGVELYTIVFVPCRHMITCNTCATTVVYCPDCGEFIEGTVTARFQVDTRPTEQDATLKKLN